MKKLLAFVLALTMACGMMGCGSSSTASTTAAAETEAAETEAAEAAETEAAEAADAEEAAETEAPEAVYGKKVAFLVNGNLGDKGFYDSCAEGVNRLASDYGCDVKIIEMGRDETTYETYFRDISEQDYDLIICCTFSVADVLATVAADYPDQQYLYLDGSCDLENVTGVSYKSYETGFMAGALAALKVNEGGELIEEGNKTVGFIGSMDGSGINDFLVGYIEGIQYIDEEVKVITAYVGSYEDVATCLEMTTQLYNQGAQIVYAPASQSITGAVTASMNCNKYIIACDNDIYTSTVDTDPDLVANVLSTSMKRMGDSVVWASTGLWSEELTVGENYTVGLAEGTVGLADNANYQALVSQETRDQLDEIAQKIIDGEITIDSAYVMEADDVAALRESVQP